MADLDRIFRDENNTCEIDFSKAAWATDKLNGVFQTAKTSILHDVDFVVETDDEIMLIEYKNANFANAVHPDAFNPQNDKKLNNVVLKYYDSQYFLHACQRGMNRKKRYIYILECLKGDAVLRKRVRELLAARLPFRLQEHADVKNRMIDFVDVVSIDEWNERYTQFPLRMIV